MSDPDEAQSSEGQRTLRLATLLRERDVDLLLVTHPVNLRYLTGFSGTNGLALIAAGRDGAPGAGHELGRLAEGQGTNRPAEGQVGHRFFTDFRYDAQSAAQVPALYERRISSIDLVEAATRELAPEDEGGEEGAADAPSLVAPPKGGRLGFEDGVLTVERHARLRELLPDTWELVPSGGPVEELREVKEPPEIARIRAAAELADEALRGVLEGGLAGRTEREVAIELELRMRRLGATGPSFPSIVAAGPHSALPHAEPRDVAIPRDTLVTIDWGALLEGYCSDCTRTYATGARLPDEARAVYELVLEAQLAGLAAIHAGPNGKELDAVAREIIEAAGHGEHFGHGLGHGVGLEVHEAPRLSRTAGEQPLRAGSVVTVEPGVYIPGRFGVRIEDLLVVSDDGSVVLTGLPKELTVVE